MIVIKAVFGIKSLAVYMWKVARRAGQGRRNIVKNPVEFIGPLFLSTSILNFRFQRRIRT